jgi:LacI family transcriptional regulator
MARKNNPTISDIARMADVSTTTVSHVLNHTRPVSKALRARVVAAIQELDYKPNAMARGLRMQNSKTLGLIIPDNSNPFFSEIALGAEDCAFRHGYSIVLCNSRHDLARELTYITQLTSYPVDGLVLCAVSVSTEHINESADLAGPMTIIDRKLQNVDADVILADHQQGARLAVGHLVELGHRRIAIITGPLDLAPAKDRLDGYRSVLHQAEIPIYDEYIVEGDFQVGSGREMAGRLLTLEHPPTAIFASNDMMAIGALHTAKKLGVHVPEDLSLVGFDNIFLSSLVDPALTSVAQPAYRLGELAVEKLISRITGEETATYSEICLPTELVVRSSTQRLV